MLEQQSDTARLVGAEGIMRAQLLLRRQGQAIGESPLIGKFIKEMQCAKSAGPDLLRVAAHGMWKCVFELSSELPRGSVMFERERLGRGFDRDRF